MVIKKTGGFIEEEKVRFRAVRSGGPGGQNVNKRSTKVQAWIKVEELLLSNEEKARVREKLAHHVNKEDELEAESEEERSQKANREKVLERLEEMVAEAVKQNPKRIPTRVPRGAEERFREERKLESLKRQLRKEGKDTSFLEEE